MSVKRTFQYIETLILITSEISLDNNFQSQLNPQTSPQHAKR